MERFSVNSSLAPRSTVPLKDEVRVCDVVKGMKIHGLTES